jgi:hypothetical protein
MAGDRGHPAGAGESDWDTSARDLHGYASAASQRTREEISRSAALAAASREHITRSNEALARLAANMEQQATIAKAAAQAFQHPIHDQEQAERYQASRKRLHAAGTALAEAEEEAARIYDRLAAEHPAHVSDFRSTAEAARDAARRAREIASQLSD